MTTKTNKATGAHGKSDASRKPGSGRKKGTPTSIDGWMMLHAVSGQVWYSQLQDKAITALAGYNGRKVRTERVMVIEREGVQVAAERSGRALEGCVVVNILKVTML